MQDAQRAHVAGTAPVRPDGADDDLTGPGTTATSDRLPTDGVTATRQTCARLRPHPQGCHAPRASTSDDAAEDDGGRTDAQPAGTIAPVLVADENRDLVPPARTALVGELVPGSRVVLLPATHVEVTRRADLLLLPLLADVLR